MSVHSIKKYKEAITLLPDVRNIILILSTTEKYLNQFSHYIPAFKVLSSMRDQRKLLEMHKKELESIVDSKGKKV